jgi:LCP family protein required for cell wall assembly
MNDLLPPDYPGQARTGVDSLRPERRPRGIKRRHGIGRAVVRTLGVLVLVGALAAIGYAGFLAINLAKVSSQPLQLGGLASDEQGRTNILVLGVGDPGHEGEGLSDSMMVISIDSRSHRVAQISIPRDMRVQIPDYGYNKINAANAFGGTTLAEQVVANTLDIPIHYFVKTNFTGLRDLVDAVGGIDVNVKERLTDTEYPCDDNQYKSCGLDIKPGLQHMDGALALKYARCRKGTCGNDFGRALRQQEVMDLVRDKAVQPGAILHPQQLFKLVQVVRDNVDTNMSAMQIGLFYLDWTKAKQNQPLSLVLSTAPDGLLDQDVSSSDLLPSDGSYDAIRERVKNIFDAESTSN